MLLTHFGHSCLLVEIADTRLLIDPGGFSTGFESLTGVDAIVVTHQHPDHLDRDRLPELLRGNPGALLAFEPSTAREVRGLGVEVTDLVAGSPLTLGEVALDPVGKQHAVIHADIPRIDNTGVVLRAAGEPSLFHPGDALDAEPGEVDILCTPINAPWCAMKETVDFVRRVAAPTMVPIHDGLLQPRGRTLYLTQVGNLGGAHADLQVLDLLDRGPVPVP